MNQLKWDESFSVQVDELDEQHKKWIDIINQLDDAIDEGEGSLESLYAVQKTFLGMEEYSHFHFATEEKHMQSIGFEGLESHKKEHAFFKKRLHKYKKDLENGQQVFNNALMKFLVDWLVYHIQEEDMKYAR